VRPEVAVRSDDTTRAPRKSGRRKNVPAMAVTELGGHIARVGGRTALARALPCSRSSLHAWANGRVNISVRWADRIRNTPVQPRRLTRAQIAEAATRARQLPLLLGDNAPVAATTAEARS
jgi:DNA-binding transcriptional regulator YdaS (Cro superfamily)